MHIEKEIETGGHWCAKVVFFILLSVLVGLVALIVLESRGINDVATKDTDSRFSQYFEGWVEEPKDHDEHDDDHSPYDVINSHEDGAFDEESLGNGKNCSTTL